MPNWHLLGLAVMPFGLNGAPATFQRMTDIVMQRLGRCTAVYLDDTIIYSETWEEHLRHIRETLQRLRDGNLTAKPSKCQFGMKKCIYLGHNIVENDEVKPDQEKLSPVVSYPVSKTKKQVHGFLGLTGYYRKFIQNYAEKAVPLTTLTRKSLPDSVKWTEDCEKSFQTLKSALC